MELELVRFQYHPKAILGYLRVGQVRFATLEEPWFADPDGPGGQRREPGHYESCVPDGEYSLQPYSGTRFQNVYALVNPTLGVYMPGAKPFAQTWGREAILIHSGNTLENTEGCILIGQSHDGYDRITGGTSRAALDQLRGLLGIQFHQLTVRPTRGTQEQL